MRTGFISFIVIIIFLGGVSVNSFAQTDSSKSDSVNISSYIQSEIESIKTKETAKKQINENEAGLIEEQAENKESGVFLGLSEGTLIKIFLLVDAALVAFLFLIWRRRKERIAKELKAKFKSNIKKLREERIKGKEDERLNNLRKNLQAHPICSNLTDNSVSTQAKKLNISKGEIYLAAKIKSFNKDEDA